MEPRVKPNGTVYVHPSNPSQDMLMIQLNDEEAEMRMVVDGTTGCLCAFAQLKLVYPHLNLILSIGGGGKGSENFAGVASDSRKTDRFIRTVKVLVTTCCLDGVDGSCPYPDDRYWPNDRQWTGNTRLPTRGQITLPSSPVSAGTFPRHASS